MIRTAHRPALAVCAFAVYFAVPPAPAAPIGPNGGGRPLWSPDGSRLAFVSGSPNTPANVWVVGVRHPSQARQLTRLGARPIAWSADGRSVYCQTVRGGRSAFYAVDASNGRERRVLSFLAQDVADVVFSPDRKRVAYLRKHDTHRDIWQAAMSGAGPRRLTEGMAIRSMDWSPDGRKIAFDVGGIVGETTYIVEVDGKEGPRAVFKGIGSFPSWSPDGSRMAVLGMHTVTLVSKSGGNQRRLHVSQADREALDWSPGGKSLAYISVHSGLQGISIINVNTESAVRVSSGWARAGFPRWSPNGRLLAFEATEKEGWATDLFLLDVHARRLRRLTQASPSSWAARWSGDGQSLFMLSNMAGARGFQVCRGDASGAAFRGVLAGDPGKPLQLSWPRRSLRGVLVLGEQIWLLERSGAPRHVLETEHPTWADISPDGNTLAYVRWRDHKPSLVLRKLSGETETELLAAPDSGLSYSKIAWSPRGGEIAFVRGDAVCIASVAGGPVAVLVDSGGGRNKAVPLQPTWSPDGKQLAFGRVRTQGEQRLEIWVVDVRQKQARLVAHRSISAEGGVYADPLADPCAWAPDGKRLAFVQELGGRPALYVVSVGPDAAARPRLLRRDAAYPSWSQDGREIIYTALNGNTESIRLLRVSDGKDSALRLRPTQAGRRGRAKR